MKTLKLLITCVLIAFCNFSIAQDKKDAKEANQEKFGDAKEEEALFAVKAADVGMAEVEFSKLAATRAGLKEVKDLAAMMVVDHTKANEELKKIAAKKNMTLPAKLSDKNQSKYDELKNLSGKDFDKVYVDVMMKDHKETIDLFEKQTRAGSDADLRAFASSKLSTLRHHLHMVEQTEETLKKKYK